MVLIFSSTSMEKHLYRIPFLLLLLLLLSPFYISFIMLTPLLLFFFSFPSFLKYGNKRDCIFLFNKRAGREEKDIHFARGLGLNPSRIKPAKENICQPCSPSLLARVLALNVSFLTITSIF